MKTIRRNCFETNSSSMHSLVYSRENINVLDTLTFTTEGEFGWENKKYSSPEVKSTYWFMQYLYWLDNKYLLEKSKYLSKYLDVKDFYERPELELLPFSDFPYPFKIKRNLKKELEAKEQEIIQYFREKGCEVTFEDVDIGDTSYGYRLIDMKGYIDHQSTPDEDSNMKDFAELNVDDLFDFIFSDSSVITGNDNE